MGRLVPVGLVAVQLVAMVAVYYVPLVVLVTWRTLKVGRLMQPTLEVEGHIARVLHQRPYMHKRDRSLRLLLWLGQRRLHLREHYSPVLFRCGLVVRPVPVCYRAALIGILPPVCPLL